MIEKNVPLRSCVACRAKKTKKELLRIVKNKNGEIFPDKSGKAEGRGMYVCLNPDCLAVLKKRKMLNRAFKCDVPESVYTLIEEAANDK